MLEGGFAWQGPTYSSLSEIAKAITGTKCNGPRFFGLREKKHAEATVDNTDLSEEIERIEVRKRELAVWLKAAGDKQQEGDPGQPVAIERAPSLLIPWTKPPAKRFKEILLPAAIERHRVRPIKFERRAALLKSTENAPSARSGDLETSSAH